MKLTYETFSGFPHTNENISSVEFSPDLDCYIRIEKRGNRVFLQEIHKDYD